AETLQARILADHRDANDMDSLDARIASLQDALAQAGDLCEQRQRDTEAAAARVRVLEATIAGLKEPPAQAAAPAAQRRQHAAAARIRVLEGDIDLMVEALAKAEALGERQRQDAETANLRADSLVAELIEVTGELTEMSKRMGEQTAATDKLRAELDELRTQS